MVILYITGAEAKLSEFGIVLPWAVVRERAQSFVQELNANGIMSNDNLHEFKASKGWIEKMKKRNNLSLSKLVGETNTLFPEDLELKITQFRTEILALMNQYGVDPSDVFNVDQTGLYYRRFPCINIVSANRKKSEGYKGNER